MRRKMLVLTVVASVIGLGCYHATIKTGKEPSARTVNDPFANGFLFGLVPPETVNTGQECTNGVAIVETQLSFINSLAAGITFGLYTPMQIDVTCAR